MSVREYAVLYLNPKGKSGGGATVGGGNTVISAGRHKLDGSEHLAPDDTTRLDATTTKHGLLPKLSGAATEYLDGAGAWSVPDAEELATAETDTSLVLSPDGAGGVAFRAETGGAETLDELIDVVITSPAHAARLRYSTASGLWEDSTLAWEPMIASDGSVMTDGLLNPMQHEVPH